MARFNRKDRSSPFNIWPGFVDALTNLLLVLIFVLTIFTFAQSFLGAALSSRDEQVINLQRQVGELADLLALERNANNDLRLSVEQLSAELQSTLAAKERLEANLQSSLGERERLEADLQSSLGERERIEANLQDLRAQSALVRSNLAEARAELAESETRLTQTRDELTRRILSEKQSAAAAEQSAQRASQAEAEIALLNRQIAALRSQLSQIAAALDAAEQEAEDQQVEIAQLGKRLNAALAAKVQELSSYRSEFFGRLRTILGENPYIRVVGDRFVFQSEVFFESASAEIGPQGQQQLRQLADVLKGISNEIPDEIDWILRVDGHTDSRPISSPDFRSNWELSSARAISVVRFLISQGIPPNRLAAAGFGEYQPIDLSDRLESYQKNRRIELKLTER